LVKSVLFIVPDHYLGFYDSASLDFIE